MVRLWALLVSIEGYADPEWPVVKGASQDTARTATYLRDDLHVPDKNIVLLTEKDATREGIISRFQSHLIHNDKIQRGDAILFHYSGHGSHTPAPPNWHAVKGLEDDEAEENPMLEMICPWDEGIPLDNGTNERICGAKSHLRVI